MSGKWLVVVRRGVVLIAAFLLAMRLAFGDPDAASDSGELDDSAAGLFLLPWFLGPVALAAIVLDRITFEGARPRWSLPRLVAGVLLAVGIVLAILGAM